MICEHKRLRCTDGIYYCLDCKIRVDPPAVVKAPTGAKEAAVEGGKRKPRKGATKA